MTRQSLLRNQTPPEDGDGPVAVTVGSTFSGCGGLDLGLKQAGMRVEWQSEIDPQASKLLAHHWPDTPNLGDITTITDPPTADLLCGGFPCQDVSVAGRRKGLAGARTSLFFEFTRLADAVRPRWVVLENVPGLLSSNDGRDMWTILNTLADVGYQDISWRVVDSLNFGVPQRRRRVFIVGRFGAGTSTRELLLEPSGRPWRPPTRSEPGAGTPRTAAISTLQGGGRRGYRIDAESAAGGRRGYRIDAESAAGGHLITPAPLTEGARVSALTSSGVGTCGADDNQAQAGHLIPASVRPFSPTITANYGKQPDNSDTNLGPNLVPVAWHENGRGELTESDAFQALSTGGGKAGQGFPAVRIAEQVRRLTPTECERLQGFPDGWTAPAGADTHRYRLCGNAVTVPVARWLGERISAT